MNDDELTLLEDFAYEFGFDISDIEVNGSMFYIGNNAERTYLVFKDEDVARKYACEYVVDAIIMRDYCI